MTPRPPAPPSERPPAVRLKAVGPPAVRSAIGASLALLIAAIAVAGCGGSDPAPADPDAAADDAPAGERQAATDEPSDARFAPFTDDAGRKWLSPEIPYDAFATAPNRSPGRVAATDTSRGGARDLLAGIGSGTPSRGTNPSPAGGAGMGGGRGATPIASMGGGAAPEAPPGDDAGGWAAIISEEDLRDEIKRSRNTIAAAVATVAAFNRVQTELPGEAAALAAMAQITAEHPADVPWKDHADAVRTLAVRVGEAAGSRGRSARDEARTSFDSLDSILGGNPPPDGAVAEFDRQLDTPRGTLMHRMGAALKYLQQEAPDEATMAENAGDLGRQAAALAALARFTADDAYDRASEPGYQRWANDLTAASVDAAREARDNDYPGFRAAVDRAAATCSGCHGEYRF